MQAVKAASKTKRTYLSAQYTVCEADAERP